MPLRSENLLPLRDGSRIVVIGGGPAGSFFALHALDAARQCGLRIRVTIFEGKDFTRRGPRGCNKCAGVLSSHLLNNLSSLQLTLPPHVVMDEIEVYVLHLGDAAVEISQPEPRRRIVSVYRGAGPRLGDLPPTVSFDGWLLGKAQERGAELIRERVTEVRMSEKPLVVTGTSSLQCDLVVLASGVNSRPVNMPNLSYVPPTTETMSQDELAASDRSSHHRVHVHSGRPAGTLFAGLVPKGPYVSVNLLGHKLGKDSVGRFLGTDPGWDLSSNPGRLCGCNPRVAVSMAHNFYADHFVAIGDAAVTRLYKDGIGSAFLTAQRAAQVALKLGVSQDAFRQGYAPLCHGIRQDNRIGRMLFDVWERTQKSRRVRQALLHALATEETLPPAKRHCRKALWDMLTGDDSYRGIARHLFNLGAAARLLTGLLSGGMGSEGS